MEICVQLRITSFSSYRDRFSRYGLPPQTTTHRYYSTQSRFPEQDYYSTTVYFTGADCDYFVLQFPSVQENIVSYAHVTNIIICAMLDQIIGCISAQRFLPGTITGILIYQTKYKQLVFGYATIVSSPPLRVTNHQLTTNHLIS